MTTSSQTFVAREHIPDPNNRCYNQHSAGLIAPNPKDAYFSETITIIVGSIDCHAFSAHRDVLTRNSEFFAGALEGKKWQEAQDKTVKTSEVEPHIFERFLTWIYEHHLGSFEGVDTWSKCSDLAELYAFGDFAMTPGLKNAVIGCILSEIYNDKSFRLVDWIRPFADSLQLHSGSGLHALFHDLVSDCYLCQLDELLSRLKDTETDREFQLLEKEKGVCHVVLQRWASRVYGCSYHDHVASTGTPNPITYRRPTYPFKSRW
ncbi:MAG: hypothetical protein M1820_008697 [Bogoriella megaspora]|nr:MAG: hypothetical protein M1820_008697 [Bogoriella megaspora]